MQKKKIKTIISEALLNENKNWSDCLTISFKIVNDTSEDFIVSTKNIRKGILSSHNYKNVYCTNAFNDSYGISLLANFLKISPVKILCIRIKTTDTKIFENIVEVQLDDKDNYTTIHIHSYQDERAFNEKIVTINTGNYLTVSNLSSAKMTIPANSNNMFNVFFLPVKII